MLKKFFLPVGLLLAILFALLLPGPGTALRHGGFVPIFTAGIFLVNGWQLDLKKLHLGRHLIKALVLAFLLSLCLGPWIGLAVSQLLALPALFALGLIIMSTVPPTLSSCVVITETSGGNATLALLMTVSLNLIGVVTIPLFLPLCLQDAEGINLSALPLLFKLAKLVLLPFVIGALVRRKVGKPGAPWIGYLPSLFVILTVLAAFSASRDQLLEQSSHLPLLILAAFLVHGTLLLLCAGAGRAARLTKADRRSLLFTGSQKTLPIAIAVLAALGDGVDAALSVCLIFHFLQLLLDAAIAARLPAPDVSAAAANPVINDEKCTA